MARKNPLGKVKDVAVESLKAPAAVAGSAVGLARDAAAAGSQLTKSATGRAAGAVTSLVGGKADASPEEETGRGPAAEAPAPEAPAKKTAAKKTAAKKTAAKKTAATKSAAKKSAANNAATKQAPAKKAPAKRAATKKAAAKKAATQKSAAKKDQPVNVTEELGLDPAPVAKTKSAGKDTAKPVTDIDAAADPAAVDVTPADVAKQVGTDG